MSAPLSFQLFHGTNADLSKAEKVLPYPQGEGGFEGQNVAFATDTKEEAAKHGKNVYEVIPDKHSHEFFGGTYYSEKGFRIKR
mgnify:FL=1